MIDGTTLCPHCNTRFKVGAAQLEAHEGMVRCGQCLQAFDARTDFAPEDPNPQLELPIPGDLFDELHAHEGAAPENELQTLQEVPIAEQAPQPPPQPHKAVVLQTITLAEQVAQLQDDDDYDPQYRKWPWVLASSIMLLLLLTQATLFFRVDIAARFPAVKPALASICQLFNCSIPLPKNTNLISIESSNLEAHPTFENQITLFALIRNHAAYAQAYPNLELTISDSNDRPLARRKFSPTDYLSPRENEQHGLLANHELNIQLRLNTTSLKPSGYRLALFYPPD